MKKTKRIGAQSHTLWVLGVASLLLAGATDASTPGSQAHDSPVLREAPSPLLAIDRNRATVVERIVTQWGEALARANAGIDEAQLREMLLAMRADQLLAASLAGSLEGLRNVVSSSLLAETELKPSLVQAKALGDTTQDVVYVPVTPCRLVETRGAFAAVYQGGGAFTPSQIRSYTLQGGNGVCLTQLPASVSPSAVQMQVYGIPTTTGSGDIEVLPQGAAFGSSASLVYLGTNAFTSSAVTSPANLANKQISVQVRGGGAHVAIDVVGYFRAPAGGYVSSITAGTGLTGGTITSFGTIAVETNFLQRRVSGSCGLGYAIQAIYNDGGVTCEAVGGGTGTVTSVGTGPGLTGGPITTTGKVNLAATQLLPTVACSSNQVPSWSGSAWLCGSPGVGNNIDLPDSTPTSGNIVKPGGVFMHNYAGGTFLGVSAGNFGSTGQGNTAVGDYAMSANGSGSFNTALGARALSDAVGSDDNTAVGYRALTATTTGFGNTATGSHALEANTGGQSNTAMGALALYSNTDGHDNAAFGSGALQSNIAGGSNVAMGNYALKFNESGGANAALGHSALYLNTTGDANVAVGYNALGQNVSGGGNTAVGTGALYTNTTGQFNLALGASAGSLLTTGSHNIHLANDGAVGEGATIRIGTPNSQTRAFVAGIRGAITGNNDAVNVVIDSAGQLGTVSSSIKVKDDVADMGDASDVLMKLHPVTFRYKAHAGMGHVQYGLIAEQVAEVAPALVAAGRDGEVETVFYQHLAPMLLNEYQKQQRRIESQQAEIAELKRAVEVLMTRTSPEGKYAAK